MSIKAVLGSVDINQPTHSVHSIGGGRAEIASGPHEITVTMSITGGYEELAKISSSMDGHRVTQEFELVPVYPKIKSSGWVEEDEKLGPTKPFKDGGDW